MRANDASWPPRAASIRLLEAGYFDAKTAAGKRLAISQKVASIPPIDANKALL